MLLEQKTAIVTGAASGIGRAIALAFAREGASLVLADIAEAGGQETIALAQRAAPRARAIFRRADAASPDDHAALVKAAVGEFGALHVAVNNAGIAGEQNRVAEMSVDGWRKVIEVNLSGVFYAMRAQLPALLDAGSGSIVNVASILGQVGSRGAAAYTAAKHGVVGLTRTAALEYAPRGVRVNAIGPGYIETPMLGVLSEEAKKGAIALHPIGRLGRAEEVAELVVWLASDRASFVTGSYYPIDGGYLAQ